MDAVVRKLLREAGRTYADEAGIALRDQAAPLFQLLVLSELLSTRVGHEHAVAAARELFAAGAITPRGLDRLSWQDRVAALKRAAYPRDDDTAIQLGDLAEAVLDRFGGDLRRLARDSGRDLDRATALLRDLPGVAPAAVDPFFREAQAVWIWPRPYFDAPALKGAERLGLTTTPKQLGDLVPDKELARFAAALGRVARDESLADGVQRLK